MNWAARVRDVFSGDEARQRRLNAALLEIHSGFLTRLAQLRRHADKAPSESTAAALRHLAGELETAATAVRAELDKRAVTVRPVTTAAEAAAGTSHWARLVADLEAQQAARDQILDCAAQFADSDAAASALFDDLLARAENHCTALRTEIARADPQALN
jgi:hypothetical protein